MRRIISLLALSLLLSGGVADDCWGSLFELEGITPPDGWMSNSSVLQMVVGQGGANPLHLVIWQENGQWVGLAVDYRARSTTLITDVSEART